jgi:hypothetical protein
MKKICKKRDLTLVWNEVNKEYNNSVLVVMEEVLENSLVELLEEINSLRRVSLY